MRWSPSISQYCIIAAILVLLIGSGSRIHTLLLFNQFVEQLERYDDLDFSHLIPPKVAESKLAKLGQALREISAPFTRTASSENGFNPSLQDFYDIKAGLVYVRISLLVLFFGTMVWLYFRIREPFRVIRQAISDLSDQKKLSEPIKICGPRDVIDVSHELENLRTRLVSNEKQRTLFLRHVSHEIKTPLSTIKEANTLLGDESLGTINDEQREITRILTRATNELQRSIENLLAYNSSDSAIDCQVREEIDLRMVLENVLRDHKLSLLRTGIRIRKVLEPIIINGDRKQIATVFDNLLSNAIKFAPANSEIRLWLTIPKNGLAEFIIRDQGPGVSTQDRESIFDAFYMGDDSTNASVKGTGIGLSLAKQYVEAHNGHIELLDTLKGASFKVVFGLDREQSIANR